MNKSPQTTNEISMEEFEKYKASIQKRRTSQKQYYQRNRAQKLAYSKTVYALHCEVKRLMAIDV